MAVVIYAKLSVTDQKYPVEECLRWVRRRRHPPARVIVEHSSAQRALRRKIPVALKQGDTLIVPSLFHFAPPSLSTQILARLLDKQITVIFLEEQLTFRAGSKAASKYFLLHEFDSNFGVADVASEPLSRE